jgi:DNA polymerase-1
MDWHHGVPVEQTITNGRDLRIAAFQNDPPTSYETSSGPGFKRYSMDALAQRYLGREGKSGLGEALAKEFGGWDHIPADDPRYVEYLREDLKVTAELDAAIPWDPYEEREARVCAITARATLSGFKVDVDGLSARAQELAERADAGRTMLAEEYGFPTTNQQGKAAAAPQRTKAGKAAFEEALKALDVPVGNWPRGADGSLSLSKENLATVHEWAQKQRPAAVPVIEAVQTMNGIRNNAANVLRHTHDGRVHPSFEPFQATGRWSILNPGLTVLKKGVADSERYFLVADEEETLVSIDLDQIDIRCVAAHSQDENLIALLNDPTRDFHNEISDMAFGDHEGGHRHAAKSLDLGWLYGRGIRGMVENTPGVTMEAAQRVDKSMRSRFGRVLEWQSEVRELGEGGVLLDNGFGRRLRVDQERAYTQSPAMLGQSTTRDLIAEGLLTLSATAPEILPMLRVIVHDEIVLSVPKRNAEEIARIAQAAMSREWAPAGASRPVRVTAGQGKPFVFGERWGQLYEK